MRVIWTRTAVHGVRRAYEYLAEINPHAASYMAQALLEAGESLINYPHRGRPVRGTTMRELVSVSPYVIRYRVAGENVVILRVRHSARRPTDP